MLDSLSLELRKFVADFPKEDQILFNNKILKIDSANFSTILPNSQNKTLAFIDGGQAEILSAGNFCLSFIRVGVNTFQNNKRISSEKREFYLFTKAKYLNQDLYYESKIFSVLGHKLVREEDLFISSNDASIKTGLERAPIAKISNMARRFAELSLAAEMQDKTDFIILDGTLEKTFANEEKYLSRLNENVVALAKSSSLFTVNGNSPLILLNKLCSEGTWSYFLENKSYLVKLHPRAKHVFRFEGDKEVLPLLVENSSDALFLGYPYGLILVDQFARVSNEEKNSLKMNFLLKAENKEIAEYLNSSNAHDILDSLG